MNRRNLLSRPALALLAIAIAASHNIPAQAAANVQAVAYAPDLLTAVPGAKDPHFGQWQDIRRSRVVQVDLRLLATVRPQDVVRVELFQDTVFLARFLERKAFGPGRYSWTGTLDDREYSLFVISVDQGAVSASFTHASLEHPYQLEIQGAPGAHVVRELEQKIRNSPLAGQSAPSHSPMITCNDDPSKIRIMVLYGGSALKQAGTSTAIRAWITAQFVYLNSVMSRSKTGTQFVLTSIRPVSYSTQTNLSTELDRLAGKKDGYMDNIHGWRDAEKADLVALILAKDRKTHPKASGIAYTPQAGQTVDPETFAFSITEFGNPSNVFTQEVCHNFGCHHDKANVSSGWKLIYPYAMAHKDNQNTGFPFYNATKFCTVVGYPNSTYPIIPYLSNPNFTYQIKYSIGPDGPVLKMGNASTQHNQRVILNMRQKIANFRLTKTWPTISTLKPASRCAGNQMSPTIMSVTATNALRYQWYKNSVAIAGQTTNKLSYWSLSTSSAGSYFCRVWGTCGYKDSNQATLTITQSCNTRFTTTTTKGNAYGQFVANAGDTNRDGYEDYLITHGGFVYLYSGRTGKTLLSKGTLSRPWYSSVAAAGDVDQDGYGDIILGRQGSRYTIGDVEIVSGKTHKTLRKLYGEKGARFGLSVACAGDVNGDGYPDAVVGAPYMDYAQIFDGKTGKQLTRLTGAKGSYYGGCVAGVGDLDQDGYDDVVVGGPFATGPKGASQGFIEVLHGPGLKPTQRVFGAAAGEWFGHSIAGLGDTNLDGYPDIAVGSPAAQAKGTFTGQVKLYSFKSRTLAPVLLQTTFHGINEKYGYSVAAAGDVDGDGRMDFHAGAPEFQSRRGYVRTMSGRTGRQIAIRFGVPKSDFGQSVAGVYADGDAKGDLLVGAPYQDLRGAAFLYHDGIASNPAEAEIYGTACKTSSALTLPRVSLTGRAAIGKTLTVGLYGAVPNVNTWLMVDAIRSNLPLTFMGAPTCVAYALPTVVVPSRTDSMSRSRIPLPLPNLTSLIGVQTHNQWAVFDPKAPGGIATSNGFRLKIGRQ